MAETAMLLPRNRDAPEAIHRPIKQRWQESLPTVILDALALRGVEDDSETIARLATSAKFRGASMAHRTAFLERHVDIARLFGPYTWDPPSPETATAGLRTLPTRYLPAYTPADKLKNVDAVARKRSDNLRPSRFEERR